MKSGRSIWTKYREAGEVIDLDGLFSDYWSSSNRELTVLSQSLSPTISHRSDLEGQRPFPLESIVALWKLDSLQTTPFVPLPPTAHPVIS